MSNIIDKVKDLINQFHCQRCGKKVDNRNQAKYCIYLEKWFERDAKSAVEIKLCEECAKPIVKILREAKAHQAMRKKDVDIDPNKENKPYHFN